MTGETPATNAKAIASGTSASATVRPERTSSLAVALRDRKYWSIGTEHENGGFFSKRRLNQGRSELLSRTRKRFGL